MSTKKYPPRWISHAIPTKDGWADPVSGKILLADKTLFDHIDIEADLKKILEDDFDKQVDEVFIESLIEESKPKKSTKKKPAAKSKETK